MTRHDFYKTLFGPTEPTYDENYARRVKPDFWNGASGEFWRGDPHSDPSYSPVNEDDRMLAYDSLLHDRAQQIYKRATANDAQRKAELLQSFLQNGRDGNLYGRPMSPEDAAVQGIVRNDVQQGERGWEAGWDQQVKNKKDALDLQKWQQEMALKKAQLRAGLQDRGDRLAELRYQHDINDRDREAKQNDYIARQKQIQSGYDEAGANQQTESGVPLADVLRSYPNLNPQSVQRVIDYGVARASKADQGYQQAIDLAQQHNDALDQALYDAEDKTATALEKKYWLRRKLGQDMPQDYYDALDKARANAQVQYLGGLQKNKAVVGQIGYDPGKGQFGPLATQPRIDQMTQRFMDQKNPENQDEIDALNSLGIETPGYVAPNRRFNGRFSPAAIQHGQTYVAPDGTTRIRGGGRRGNPYLHLDNFENDIGSDGADGFEPEPAQSAQPAVQQEPAYMGAYADPSWLY